MRRLPDRVYPPDAALRKRYLRAESNAHPAKARLSLLVDLVLRYSLPGQTIVDPFGGIGSLLPCAAALPLMRRYEQPRNVILHELEPRFVEMARTNWVHLQWLAKHDRQRRWLDLATGETCQGGQLGQATILQGDSRHLPLPDGAGAALGFGSPPYAETNTYQQPGAGGEQWELLRAGLTPQQIAAMRAGGDPRVLATRRDAGYSRHRANVANLPYTLPPTVALSSPPYADVLHRDRTIEPSSQADGVRFGDRYGDLDPARHGDGYADHTPGQIGDLTYGGPAPQDYRAACTAVYAEVRRVVQPGGLLVLVTGDFVREGRIVPLGDDTVELCRAAGWTPLERWRALKSQISFWRRLHAQQAAARGEDPAGVTVTHEEVLVFCRGTSPAWPFRALPPQRGRAGVRLPSAGPSPPARQAVLALPAAGTAG